MLTCTVAEVSSEREYKFYFQINRQSAYEVNGIDFQTYIKIKHSNSFARTFVTGLINSRILLNEEDNVEVLWKSIDGIDFVRIEDEPINKVNDKVPCKTLPVRIEQTNKPCNLVSDKVSSKSVPRLVWKRSTDKKKSNVWTLFVKTPVGGTCKICNASVKTSGNTTNLTTHINRHHQGSSKMKTQPPLDIESDLDDPDDPKDIKELDCGNQQNVSATSSLSVGKKSIFASSKLRQPRIDTVVANMSSFKDGGTRSREITDALLYMLAKDDLPLSATEKTGFKYFIHVLAPLYKAPQRNSLTVLMERKYENLSTIIKEKLARLANITLTADVWTDTMNVTSYLGCTAHFLDEDHLASLVLGIIELSERHTAAYVAQNFRSVCENWKIPLERVTVIVTDNGSNIVKAACDTFGFERHLPCFAHSLNLVLTSVTAVQLVKDLISKVKTIVTYFGYCTPADELRKAQTTPALRLIQSVPTRWNSTFHMLERFLALINVVSSVLLKLPKSPPMLTATEVAILREITEILKPADSVTKEMCGQNYITTSKIIPILDCLKKAIVEVSTSSDIGQSLKKNILKEIEKRFAGIEQNSLTAIATILDPRFMRLHFSTALSCSKAIGSLNDLIKQNSTRTAEPDVDVRKESKSTSSVWKFHEELVKNSKIYQTDTLEPGCLHPHLAQYLSKTPLSLDTDPIQYWIKQKENYPQLASIALKYLSIVATSVPCERLFSMAGNVLSPNRNRLSSVHVNQLLFLKSLEFKDWRL